GTETHQTPRDVSFCTHVTARQAPLVVRDAARDPYFAENPLVAADGTGFRAYCGVPITDGAGTVLAVLCVVDGCARDFDDQHVAALRELAQAAATVLLGAAAAPTLPQLAASPQPARPALDEPLPLELDPLHAWIDAAMPTADEFDDEVARRSGRRRIRLPLRARSAARAGSLQPS
ncbi:MAG: multi-sensor hybrid histidine kinase, partial [Thermoleophilia bacterium]|nr:multi-sensor hybrid histidine kinase [Thermoleophilia bacterium]